MYYFLLPSSKIRDATFLFNEEGKNIIVIMSSAGYMYTQIMDESSSAQHGPFYVTNVLEINHEDLKVRNAYLSNVKFSNWLGKDHTVVTLQYIHYVYFLFLLCLYTTLRKPLWFQDSNGQVAGGGVSVYYSHVLQMLFFSYSQGKSFAATVSRSSTDVQRLFSINIKG